MPQSKASLEIAKQELELAKLQSKATYVELEGALERSRLRQTMNTASVMAGVAKDYIDEISQKLDASVTRMTKDLSGEHLP